jgi:hypothetical protein
VKIDIDPPNIKVVAKTTTKVEVTNRPALGAYTAFIYWLKAKAIAPLITPENQIRISYLNDILSLNLLHIARKKAGIKTPAARAIIQEIRSAKKNRVLNYSYSIAYIDKPR